jgi:hypothetical protein
MTLPTSYPISYLPKIGTILTSDGKRFKASYDFFRNLYNFKKIRTYTVNGVRVLPREEMERLAAGFPYMRGTARIEWGENYDLTEPTKD